MQNPESTSMPKVLLVFSDCDPTHGAFLSGAHLARQLNLLGCTCDALIPRLGEAGVQLLNEFGIRYHFIRSYSWTAYPKVTMRAKKRLQSVANRLLAQPKIAQLIVEEGYDIIHINTAHGYVAARPALKLGKGLVWHIRELLEEDQGSSIVGKRRGYALMSKSDVAIAISNAVQEKYERLLTCPVERIYNGIDPASFYAERDDLFSLDLVRMVIVGGLYPHKGQLELVEALGELLKLGEDGFHLSIVGRPKGEYYEEVRAAVASRGLEAHVTFEGETNDPGSYYRKSDVAFVCSRAEAFGRVTVEAMMAGCAVIGADTGGTREVLDEGGAGFLYHAGDVASLAAAIRTVLEDTSHAQSVARCGQERAMNLFTVKKNAEQVLALYTGIKG
ncbi:MAG: glycosyltransferase family 4 protein [Atopobiaceae bacterium]|nr:glycosyltransferase family 4 protein [Atopobiaceae bacterium]